MYKREKYLSQLINLKDTDFIKVITGVRRSGKSVLLKQYMDYLMDIGVQRDHIIYINLESFEYRLIREEEEFSNLCLKLLPNDGEKSYLLIDEVQNANGWQRVINSLRVSFNVDIVITGSNAKLLSGELATLLSGRYVEIVVYPFSFKEFLEAKGIDFNSREVDLYYGEYEKYGGFPSVVLSDVNIKSTILSGIFDSIILNDIAARGMIKDTFALKRLVGFLSDNVGQLINPSKISNILLNEKLNISNHTVNKYLELLSDAYLFYEVKAYNIRGKAFLRQNSKYFIVDNGLRNHATGFMESNFGNRLENIVFLELLRRGYSISIARIEDREIDFLARKDGSTEYYQVAYELPSNSHETDNLLMTNDNFKKTLITGRYVPVKNIDGINIVYIVDFLLEN